MELKTKWNETNPVNISVKYLQYKWQIYYELLDVNKDGCSRHEWR